jgi:hypothetical protein
LLNLSTYSEFNSFINDRKPILFENERPEKSSNNFASTSKSKEKRNCSLPNAAKEKKKKVEKDDVDFKNDALIMQLKKESSNLIKIKKKTSKTNLRRSPPASNQGLSVLSVTGTSIEVGQ